MCVCVYIYLYLRRCAAENCGLCGPTRAEKWTTPTSSESRQSNLIVILDRNPRSNENLFYKQKKLVLFLIKKNASSFCSWGLNVFRLKVLKTSYKLLTRRVQVTKMQNIFVLGHCKKKILVSTALPHLQSPKRRHTLC